MALSNHQTVPGRCFRLLNQDTNGDRPIVDKQ